MWWPAIGGLIVGLGGLVEPRALGVGYDVIDDLLTGRATLTLIVGILVVKSLIWGLSLGSGTSGGVLAPAFMIGAALGALEGHVLPSPGPGFWALIGLAAVVGGVMRSPFTGVVFTLELTHAWPALLALLLASVSAYGVSVLVLGRSVLTEKIARRGYHLSREYDVDPLEVLFVEEVMDSAPTTLEVDRPLPAAVDLTGAVVRRRGGEDRGDLPPPRQRLFPVVDADGRLVGVVPLGALGDVTPEGDIADVLVTAPLVVAPRDTLRSVRTWFADRSVTSAPVVDPDDGTVRGLITVDHLLDGHLHDLAEEHDRERADLAAGRGRR
jgi:CBS domain-containing protein